MAPPTINVRPHHPTSFEPIEPAKKSAASILIEVSQLVSLLLSYLPKISARKLEQTDGMKDKYQKLTAISAHCHRTSGTTDFWTAVGTSVGEIAVSVIFGGAGKENVLKVSQDIVGKGPQFVRLYTSRLDANRSQADFELNRINSELSEVNNNEQNYDLKTALFQGVQSAIRCEEAASRSG